MTNTQSIALVLTFAVLFTVIGFAAPVLYLQAAPQSSFVTVHDFSVQDSHVGADEHTLCFNRTVKRPADADITVELSLIRDDGVRVEKDSFNVDAYYQQGQDNVQVKRNVRDPDLTPGTYQYLHRVQLTYYGGWVEKEFTFVSDEFTVYANTSTYNTRGTTHC